MPNSTFVLTETWKTTYPHACVGVLILAQVENPDRHAALEAHKAALEAAVRQRYGGMDRAALRREPVWQAYHAYYKRFKKSYHVQLQLESVAWKSKSIPTAAALVEAMFMAELKNHLLTSGHDLDAVAGPAGIAVAQGTESYTLINGRTQQLKAGDMYIFDEVGVLSSIIYGPDTRTRIRPETTNVIFTVYAPAGVAETAVVDHLGDIEEYVRLFSPRAQTQLRAVYGPAPTTR